MIKVLLIDDEPFVTKALRVLIDWEKYGFTICGEAGDGENGLKIIEELKPDLVITDIRMPKMDGLELIKYCSKNLKRRTKFIILSGYGDFKYAQQAMKYGVKDYLLKPIDEDELIEMLISIKAEIEEELKQQLLLEKGNIITINRNIENILKGCGDCNCESLITKELMIKPGEALRYIVIKIHGEAEINSEYELEGKEEIYSILKEKFNIQVFKFTNNYIKALIKDSGLKINSMTQNLKELISLFMKVFGLKVSLLISGRIDEIIKLNEAYNQMKTIITYKFYEDDKNLVFYEDVMNIDFNYRFEKALAVGGLVEAIEKGERESIKASINEIFNQFHENFSAFEVIKTYINNLIVELIKIVNDIGSDDAKEFILECSTIVDSIEASNFAKVKEATMNLCLKSIDYIYSLKSDNIKGAMKDIERFIKQHYMEDINLKLISQKFYMNSVYLGQQFKKCFGTYFNDYLNEIRITEAKKLLTRTNKRVYEIAQCVGFKNTDYFVGRFEKCTNMTPSEYKSVNSKTT